MKLPQLPLGARFEWEGNVYVKTGPITGAAEDGGQRMIPRYALLKPLDGQPATPQCAARKLDEAAVLTAFEVYHQAALRLVDEAGKLELAAARDRFRTRLS